MVMINKIKWKRLENNLIISIGLTTNLQIQTLMWWSKLKELPLSNQSLFQQDSKVIFLREIHFRKTPTVHF